MIKVVGVCLLAVASIPASARPLVCGRSSKPVELQGTVTKMEWINPHSSIHVDVSRIPTAR